MNIERVAVRVKNGGHHIPAEDIVRRHDTSMQNLISHLHLLDHLIVVDNSRSEGETALVIRNGLITHRAESLPHWVEIIEQQYLT
ncbi:hypothetical protein J21TS3_46590 [Paenibacillus cookii]|uniref:Uncharacterized protein n=1 Tax=Paenibacillus cookii TaxID=157839 RepID=A0ABQ4M358_9BACL|nr:hypothetical protein J21TS3_46590 [Paenibacillus cookii]